MRRSARLALCLLGAVLFCVAYMAVASTSLEDGLESQRRRALSRGELGLWLLWTCLTRLGTRRVVALLKAVFPQYATTTFYYGVAGHSGASGLVALTIDDAVCRQSASHSMLAEVLALLRTESARATFFLSSDYVREGDAAAIVRAGHELGNHLPKDSDEYAALAAADFERALLETEGVLEPVRARGARRWFRAPGGRLTRAMVEVLQRHGISHALGDVYADDWQIRDPETVANLYLRQADEGSVVIMHMPERGFRQHTLEAMRLVLQGLAARGLKVVTLGQLSQAALGAA